jgi:uncharacterized protein (DUF58 family)
MNHPYARSSRSRENITFVALAILLGGGIFLYVLLIGGALFLATLGALAVMTVVGAFHYLFWGRSLERDLDRQAIEGAQERFAPSVNGDAPPSVTRSPSSHSP